MFLATSTKLLDVKFEFYRSCGDQQLRNISKVGCVSVWVFTSSVVLCVYPCTVVAFL